MNGGQPQAGTFANLSGREKWVEDPFDRGIVHAAAGIANSQLYVRTHGELRISLHNLPVQPGF